MNRQDLDDETSDGEIVAKGKRAYVEYCHLHDPDAIRSVLYDFHLYDNEYYDDEQQLQEECADDETKSPPTALARWGTNLSEDLVPFLAKLIRNVEYSTAISLEMHQSDDTWLLPTYLCLLPQLERITISDPVLNNDFEPWEFWSQVYQCLQKCHKLRILTVKWSAQPTINPTGFGPEGEWLKILMQLDLEEYHHDGQSDISSRRWTRARVMRLLHHKTLRVVRLHCPLEAGSWPCRAEQALWRLPNRITPLRLILPGFSQQEREKVKPNFPVRI